MRWSLELRHSGIVLFSHWLKRQGEFGYQEMFGQ